ncbi:sugar ABC transporter substrate-binding protein [Celeribacter naphthalenivorans]|uniref:sugar ABC transporter substrate-binding protein n=1 Tax=Celeribacter naphthalenivorans TaxID=1614694 RepID=UPI001CF985FD|nr:sugar ABC transporter substrate-binding protein [Celeribacter naphthalenivorans]
MKTVKTVKHTLALSTALASVAGLAHAEDVTIALIVTNFQNVAEVSMAEGFKTKGEELGATVLTMDAKGSIERQANAIQDVLSQGVDGLAIEPLDSAVAQTWVDQGVDMGIPIAAMAVQVGDPSNPWNEVYPGLSAQVGRDDYVTAIDLATYSAGIVDTSKTVKIGLIEGMPGYSTVINLTNGFKKGLEDAGVDYEIVMSQPTDWTQTKGQEVCQNALIANPDIDLFFTHAQTMAVGCADAAEDSGSDVKIVSAAGALAAGQDYVRDGRISAAACEPWREIGAATAEALYEAATNPDAETGKLVTMRLPIYTAENVDSCVPQW